MSAVRRSPPFWRHDAYTLNQLRRHITEIAAAFHSGALIGRISAAKVNIVDFGAGAAPYRDLFDAPGICYQACDLDAGADVVFEPGMAVPLPDGSAKLVLSFQVLEHVWDLDWYLAEVRRLMAPEGVLVLSTHGTWLYHPHPTDFRRWTRDGLVAELSTRGFAVKEVRGIVGPLAWTTQFRALGLHRLLGAVPLLGAACAAVIGALMHLRMRIEDALTPAAWTANNAAIYLVIAGRADAGPT